MLDESGVFVIMAVLGGMRSIWGPLVGAAIYVVPQDCLSTMTQNWMSFIGLFFILIVLFFPPGVLGIAAAGASFVPEGRHVFSELSAKENLRVPLVRPGP